MANVQYVNLADSDSEMEENSVKYTGSVQEIIGPAVDDWYSSAAIRRAKKRLNAERMKVAMQKDLFRRYRLAKRQVRVEKARLETKRIRLEKVKKMSWCRPKSVPKPAKGRNAPVGHPRMALIVAAHRLHIADLIKETQEEVLRKLPKSSALRQLNRGQIQQQLMGFTGYLIKKIAQLREINSAFFDYDKVIGGTVFHVERLICQLKNVLHNIDKYVLGQLEKDTRCTNFRRVGKCPVHWNSQVLLASLSAHLDKEREVVQKLVNSYIAVSRVPPVIPPWHPPTSVKSVDSQEI